MNTDYYIKIWPLIYSTIRVFWEITEPQIEAAAIKGGIPIELYYYAELGLEYFSIENFQKRDPFTNPDQFEKMFARFEIKDWIFPVPDERYQVSRKAQDAVRQIVKAGDARLAGFSSMPEGEIRKLLGLLKQITVANLEAPQPPEKWAIIKRFRVADSQSPLIAQIREYLMDLFAYRDDCHLCAAHPYFGQAGIVWSVLGMIGDGNAVNAKQLADTMSFRGYEEEEYEIAIQAAVELGWLELVELPDRYGMAQKGIELRERVEQKTNEFFYRPWEVMANSEVEELFASLSTLRECLVQYKSLLN